MKKMFLSLCCMLLASFAPAFAEQGDGTLSQISVRFEATYANLADLADSRLPMRVEGRESFSQGALSGSVKYVIIRKGRPVVRREGDSVAMDVPLYFTATFSGGSMGLPLSANADGEMLATVVAKPRVLPDWRISTDPKVRISWRKPPAINMMGLRISFQPVADRVVRDWVDQKKGRIDVVLNERLALKRRAQELWNHISKPLSIGEGDILWLVMNPERFWATPLEVNGGGVFMAAGLDARMKVVGGAFPGRPVARPLPDLVSGRGDGSFRVILPATIHYAFANSLIARNWTPRDIPLPNDGKARLERFGMTGRGDRFVLGAELIGTDGKGAAINSVVNFLGRPFYDISTRTVSVEDLAVEVGAGGESLAFLNDSVVPSLRDVLRFPIGDQLDQLQKGLSKALSGLSYGGAKLDFRPSSFGVIGVKADSQGIRADVQAQGVLAVSIR
ncbi:MAG: DUF4403 family protein [Thermanaerothrix sp.]|nr:DUF4403 family protein [Thermanaerothrix sp.]